MPKLVGVVKKEAVTSKPKKGEDVVAFHGLDKAGWLSQLLWLWIDEIVTTANREPLKTEHLGRLPQSSHSDSLMTASTNTNKNWIYCDAVTR